MKCPKCPDGELRSKGSGFRKKTGFFTRHRICNKCGYRIKTVEVPYDMYEAESVLMREIEAAVNKYADSRNVPKSE